MSIYINLILSLTISFIIVYLVVPKIIKISTIKKLFDVPNQRSAAKKVIPTMGGLAIVMGFSISLIISSVNFNIDELKYMFVGVIAMFSVGLKDDIIGLSPKKKLYVEIIVGFYLVIVGHFRLTNLHGIFGITEIEPITGSIITVIAIIGFINALNLIDGIDGLASGVVILISLTYGLIFLFSGDYIYALTCFSLLGGLLSFFFYNVFGKKNKIFMGDTGSLVLGLVVSVLTIRINEFTPPTYLTEYGFPAISFAIVIVPIIDTLRVFAIRIAHKKSPFAPDMNHIHHNLLFLTGSHLKSSLIIIGANAFIIVFAFSTVKLLGNTSLFFVLFVSGFVLADIPSLVLSFKAIKAGKVNEHKSIFAFTLFQKKSRNID